MANILVKIISGIINVADKVTDVIFKERRARARVELETLEKERKELMNHPPTVTNILKIIKIDKRIEYLNSYLKNV